MVQAKRVDRDESDGMGKIREEKGRVDEGEGERRKEEKDL